MVATGDRPTWAGPELRVAIGRALVTAPGPLTAKDLEVATGTHQSNVRREAQRMAQLGLVTRVPNPERRTARGASPKTAFTLGPAQRRRAKRELAGRVAAAPTRRRPQAKLETSAAEIGQLRRGQELVIAPTYAASLPALIDSLRSAEPDPDAAWAALSGEELLVAFEGDDPAGAALKLLAALAEAGIPARRASVARVGRLGEFFN
jgi:hypothetical protein